MAISELDIPMLFYADFYMFYYENLIGVMSTLKNISHILEYPIIYVIDVLYFLSHVD